MSAKPVWLEEWTVGPSFGEPFKALCFEPYGSGGKYVLASPERAQLAASAPALVRALLLAEVGKHVVPTDFNWYTGAVCGVCDVLHGAPHADGCALDAALKAAGFPQPASRDAARKLMKETR